MTSEEFASELEQFHDRPRMTSEEIVAELKRLHADQDTTNFGVYDFISAFGTPLEAVMYSKLFWPDFIEIEGMVIRSVVISTFALLIRNLIRTCHQFDDRLRVSISA